MKKLRKLLAVAAAAVLTAASAGSICANAVAWRGKDVVFEGYTEFEDIFTYNSSNNIHYKCFYKATDKHFNIIEAMNYPCSAHFIVPESADLEAIESTVKAVCPGVIVSTGNDILSDGHVYKAVIISGTNKTGMSDEEYNELNLTSYQAKQICNALKEKGYIDNFKYDDCNLTWVVGDFSLPGYFFSEKGDKERLEAYFEETGLDFFVKEEDDSGMVRLDTNLTGKEAFEGMVRIANDTGIKPRVVYLMGSENDTEVIDMFGAVDGDANADGRLDISDAVLIMQSLSNPNKYALTTQGSFNADIAGGGDGITLGDALAVQEMLLGSR